MAEQQQQQQPKRRPDANSDSSPRTAQPKQDRRPKAPRVKPSPGAKLDDNGNGNGKGGKLRGLDRDSPDVRLSKTLSWLLRHGAGAEGLEMRRDGFVRVDDLVRNGRLKPLGLTLEKLQEIVKADSKQRFMLLCERWDEAGAAPSPSSSTAITATATAVTTVEEKGAIWLIKANQGHTIKNVELDLKPITNVTDIPSGVAVHGTTRGAWQVIKKEGLSRMKRNHIHLAQGVGGNNVISGMRKSSQILIFINVQKALEAGIVFELSDNGVVLTVGDERGYLGPEFFERVEDVREGLLRGWEGKVDGAVVQGC